MIEVKTKFDYQNAALPLKKFQMRKTMPRIICLSAIFLTLGVITLFIPDFGISFRVFLFSVGLLLPIGFLLPFLFVKRSYKTMKVMSDDTYNYFRLEEEKCYDSATKGENVKSSSEYTYDMFYKVFETRTHFFLYISKMQAFVLPKADIITGTADMLRDLFVRKLGKKFKSYIR